MNNKTEQIKFFSFWNGHARKTYLLLYNLKHSNIKSWENCEQVNLNSTLKKQKNKPQSNTVKLN